jgi:uncharacterized protein YprB with RNaseH-like and TPR domain
MEQKKREIPEYLIALSHALKKPEHILFLDIETAGPEREPYTTVIGWAIGGEYKHWVRRQPLRPFFRELERAHAVATFNGKAFDIPFLLKEFPELKIPEVHLDLMHLLWAGGMKGGQKKIEVELGVRRPAELKDLRGWDAVKLWRAFGRTRNREHLDMLIRYNREDVMNMIPLLAHGAELHGENGDSIVSLMRDGRKHTGEIMWS